MSQRSGNTAVVQPPVTGADQDCKHFWVIDSPSGPVSRGQCDLCGDTREFKNYLEAASYWEDEPSAESAASGGHYRPRAVVEVLHTEE
ncbi:MAG: hypothetical protein EXR48_00355 [Dehalococcoidia bacterium]|nr:hypothetical protein [Dehalococcoidia bacterium]